LQAFLEDARKTLSQSVKQQAASAQTAADKYGGYYSQTWTLPFALCLLQLCNAESRLLPLFHVQILGAACLHHASGCAKLCNAVLQT